MLIKLIEYLKKANHYETPYKGKVIDNEDPKKLGRVKVQIEGLLQGEKEVLPWIHPQTPANIGGGESSAFYVPEVGSQIVVVFPYEDVYFGFYTGVWENSGIHNPVFDTDYPHTYGWQDSRQNGFLVNKKEGNETIEIKHTSGTKVTIDKDGNLLISTKGNQGNLQINIQDEAKITAEKNIDIKSNSSEININAANNLTVKSSAETHVEAAGNVLVKGTVVDVQGSSQILLNGDSGGGVVTQNCKCAFTGAPHFMHSSTVKAGGVSPA